MLKISTGLNISLLEVVEIHNRNSLPLLQQIWSKNTEEQVNDEPAIIRPHFLNISHRALVSGSFLFLLLLSQILDYCSLEFWP